MNPLSPKQILRNLENGFFMTHQEQTEAAQLIRQLQESNRVLSEAMILQAEEIVNLRRQSHNPTGFTEKVIAKRLKIEERKVCANLIRQKARQIYEQAEMYAVSASETANAQDKAWELELLAIELETIDKE